MGIVINGKRLNILHFNGKGVLSCAYCGFIIFRIQGGYINFSPDHLTFNYTQYQEEKEFSIMATDNWYLEEVF